MFERVRSSRFFATLLLVTLLFFLSSCGGSHEDAVSRVTSPQGGDPQSSPAPTPGAGGNFTISVTDLDGNGIKGAVVRLAGTQEVVIASGSDGSARFDDLHPGEYTVQASKGNTSHPRIEFEVNGGKLLMQTVVLRTVKEFEIVGHIRDTTDFRFNGSSPGPTISVEHGDLVRLLYSVPENDIAHAFAIDEFGVSSPTVHKGEATVIEFVADQVGNFHYYCPLPSHRTLGMEGEFGVKQAGGER